MLREGKEEDQGVGYLDDGTMVVIEGGRRRIGEEVEVEVTSVLQNPSGKMIFTRVALQGAARWPLSGATHVWRWWWPAAGYGTRLGLGLPKQYVPLLGIPMLQRTLDTLGNCPAVDALVVVVNEPDVEYCRVGDWCRSASPRWWRWWPAGRSGRSRCATGWRALAEAGTWDLVGIHDGARPLVTCDDDHPDGGRPGRRRSGWRARCSASPAPTPSRSWTRTGVVTATPDRRTIWRAQTPQIFRWEALMDAYAETAEDELLRSTDDASLVEARGGRVVMVKGSAENFKVTDRVDLRHAEQILAERRVTEAVRRPADGAERPEPGAADGGVGHGGRPASGGPRLRRPPLRPRPRPGAGRGKIARARRPAGPQ